MSDDTEFTSGWASLRRGEVERFAAMGTSFLIAPFFDERPLPRGYTEQDRAVARLLYEPLFRALDRIEGVRLHA